MNLQELKQSLREDVDMSDVYSKIKRYAGQEDYLTFPRHTEDDSGLSEIQVNILREAGYTVEWNRPCLWYEVSGWK